MQESVGLMVHQQSILLRLREAWQHGADTEQICLWLEQLKAENSSIGNAALAGAIGDMRSVLMSVEAAIQCSTAEAVAISRHQLLDTLSSVFLSRTSSRVAAQVMPMLLRLLQSLQFILATVSSPAGTGVADATTRFACMQLLISLMKIHTHPESLGAPCIVCLPLQADPTGM